jgi:hypothetical protein
MITGGEVMPFHFCVVYLSRWCISAESHISYGFCLFSMNSSEFWKQVYHTHELLLLFGLFGGHVIDWGLFCVSKSTLFVLKNEIYHISYIQFLQGKNMF